MSLHRRIGTTLTALALAAPLAAQAPRGHTASFDIGALTDHELRLRVEPLRFGALALDVSLAARDNAPAMASSGAVPVVAPPTASNTLTGSEYGVDIGPRFYSAVMRMGPGLGVSVYVGALAGLHRRDSAYPPCQAIACPAVLRITPVNMGVEPTGEVGARFLPNPAVLVDVGLRTRVITFPDPIGNYTVGEVVPRLSLSLGVNW